MKASKTISKALIFGVAGAAAGFIYAFFAFMIVYRYGGDYEAFHIFVAPVLGGIAAYVIGRESERIHEQTKMLIDAKDKFSALTQDAITQRDWRVSFEDNAIPTCWKVKGCDALDCPSYGKEHARCC